MSNELPKEKKTSPFKKYLKYVRNILYVISLSSIVKDFEVWEQILVQVNTYLKSFGLIHTLFVALNWVIEKYSYWVELIFWFCPSGISLFISLILIIFIPFIYYLINNYVRPIYTSQNLSEDEYYKSSVIRFIITMCFLSIFILIHEYYFSKIDLVASRYFLMICFFLKNIAAFGLIVGVLFVIDFFKLKELENYLIQVFILLITVSSFLFFMYTFVTSLIELVFKLSKNTLFEISPYYLIINVIAGLALVIYYLKKRNKVSSQVLNKST